MDLRFTAKLLNMAASLKEVGELFALTPEQMEDPRAGEWLIDRIKQLQTAHIIRKEMAAKVNFPQDPGLPPTTDAQDDG